MRNIHSRQGFTLIELLIVVAIIAILAAIAVPNFLEAQVRSKVSRSKSDMRSIATALESYVVDNNKYPPSWARQDGTAAYSPSDLGFGPVATPVNPRIQRLAWVTTPIAYMTSIPNDAFAVGVDDSDPLNEQYPVPNYWDQPFVENLRRNTNAEVIFEDMPEILGGGASWELIGYGPDQSFYPAAFWPYQRVYDPTNGTISPGDIIRYGGAGDIQ